MEVSSTTDAYPDGEQYILLRQFIQELKELDRALILLHLEGLSSIDIAEVMAMTPTNVTTKISRIKKQLKIKFDNHKNK